MQYTSHYESPLGDILLAADEAGLTGLWFADQKYYAADLDKEHEEKEISLFGTAKQWLDIYFSGKEPDFSVPLHFIGTDFQKEVWEILCTIPYGQTMTYGGIAEWIAASRGVSRMSAQAVGGAVGQNIAGAMSNMMGGINQQTIPGAVPPPIPVVAYHVAINGQAAGPFDMTSLTQMAASGQLASDSLVWRKGMAQWAKAGTLDDLKVLFENAMPAIPPQG